MYKPSNKNLNKEKELSKSDFLLFKPNEKMKTCQLKHFIHFLYGQGASKPLNFSYVEGQGNLISNITIRENIYLDSMPSSLTDSKDFQLKKLLEKTGNSSFIKLFNKITLLDELPNNVDDQTRKLASLTKAILRPTDFLLLEYPERFLGQENLGLLKEALKFQQNSFGQIVLVFSDKGDIWNELASHIVTRSMNHKFNLVPVISTELQKKFLPIKAGLVATEGEQSEETTKTVLPFKKAA